MDFIAGCLSVLAGIALLTWSAQAMRAANDGHRLPYWTNPHRYPRRSVWLRVAGAFLLMLGIGLLSNTLGYWSVALVVVAFAPGVALIALHNRRLA